MNKGKNIKGSRERTKEILMVLNILYNETDKQKKLKYVDYVDRIKEKYNYDIDRRRISDILSDLYDAQNKSLDLLPFDIESLTGKYNRGNSILSNNQLDKILEAIDNYDFISKDDANVMKEYIKNQQTVSFKSQFKEKNIRTNHDDLLSKKLDKYLPLIREKKFGEIVLNLNNKNCINNWQNYPKDKTLFYSKGLRGFVFESYIYKGTIYLCFLVEKTRYSKWNFAISVDIDSVDFFPNDDELYENKKFVKNFKIVPKQDRHQYKDVYEWYESLKFGKSDRFTYIKFSFDNQIKNRVIKKFGDNVDCNKNVVEIEYDFNDFIDWYLSDNDILTNVNIIYPSWLAYNAMIKSEYRSKVIRKKYNDLIY